MRKRPVRYLPQKHFGRLLERLALGIFETIQESQFYPFYELTQRGPTYVFVSPGSQTNFAGLSSGLWAITFFNGLPCWRRASFEALLRA